MKSLLVLLAILSTASGAHCGRRGYAYGTVCDSACDTHAALLKGCEVATTRPPHRRHHHGRGFLTKRDYVDTVVRFLDENYWRCVCPSFRGAAKEALCIVYEMLHQNFTGLVVFTSHVVFGTGGLLRLQAGTERWASRGILQITGEGNYRKLCTITESDFFYRHPHALATLRPVAVEASVRFWLCLVEEHLGCYKSAEVSFWETLRLLGPSETRCPESPESRARIQNRKAVYDALLAALCECAKRK